ncbi:hypothetical protein FRC07_013472, partial [Ceratobasidium sp. 392]
MLAKYNKVVPATLKSALPLPGLRELSDAAESLMQVLQDSPFESARCFALAFKIRFIRNTISEIEELDPEGALELDIEMCNMKRALDDTSVPGRLDYRKAKRNIEVIEELERRSDAIIELMK